VFRENLEVEVVEQAKKVIQNERLRAVSPFPAHGNLYLLSLLMPAKLTDDDQNVAASDSLVAAGMLKLGFGHLCGSSGGKTFERRVHSRA
jgi:hypothetical protein